MKPKCIIVIILAILFACIQEAHSFDWKKQFDETKNSVKNELENSLNGSKIDIQRTEDLSAILKEKTELKVRF